MITALLAAAAVAAAPAVFSDLSGSWPPHGAYRVGIDLSPKPNIVRQDTAVSHPSDHPYPAEIERAVAVADSNPEAFCAVERMIISLINWKADPDLNAYPDKFADNTITLTCNADGTVRLDPPPEQRPLPSTSRQF